ncbi:hypothetical protein [Roseovarius tolerans]|uniref:hypothetical protein n=1 Tax=Roseovarius tolerans TaxID=74031 RepID=UPI00128CC107|nr:hypothetical protein [Roseovarius tolerans]
MNTRRRAIAGPVLVGQVPERQHRTVTAQEITARIDQSRLKYLGLSRRLFAFAANTVAKSGMKMVF